jgi:UDP-N-acetylglucosamine--N-acetylmuramyl-(pentapeptide) pyrophosphoryl-undecaprenol N-acetylglucosamine transferase
MTKKKTIILAAGGTGGHFFPALAGGEVLSSMGAEVHLITDLRCQKYLANDLRFKHHIIDLYFRTNGLLNKLKIPLQLLKAIMKAYKLIKTIKPDAIVGFGGYPSFPAMFVCKLLGVPMVIHEQNCFLGKANKFFGATAQKIALSYKETNNIDERFAGKIVVTGNIIRSGIKTLPEKKDFNSEIFHLFIVGGSQGAKFFSGIVPEAIGLLLKNNPAIQIELIHQASKEDQQALSDIYKALGIKYTLSDFFFDIDKIYQKSDLVIARSGASTIAELTHIGLPAIFIPFPFAAEDHQYHNGMALQDIGAGWCYRQTEITPHLLATKLAELINDRSKLKQASLNLIKRKSDGSKTLADTVFKIIE